MDTKRLLMVGSIVMLAVAGSSAAAAVYFYRQYHKALTDPKYIEEYQNQAVLTQLRKVMELPEETPTFIVVDDREKLQEQAFFEKAQNGDRIVIYENARKIILYRPETKKVIGVAPLVFTTPADEAPDRPFEERITIQPTISLQPTQGDTVPADLLTGEPDAPTEAP